MNEQRLKHSVLVAKKMVQIATQMNLSQQEKEICFLIGYLHDVGYQFTNNENHNRIGGEMLKNTGFQYWQEIYFHGEIDVEFHSKYLDILNQADMQIDLCGNDVGYDKRLEDIKKRYGKNSVTYQKCHELIKRLKKMSK